MLARVMGQVTDVPWLQQLSHTTGIGYVHHDLFAVQRHQRSESIESSEEPGFMEGRKSHGVCALALPEVDELQQQRMDAFDQIHRLLSGVADGEVRIRLNTELEEVIALPQVHACHHTA